MTDDALAEAVLLPIRWQQHHIDVCAVLTLGAVRWVVRDVLEAIDGDPGDFADDPGHHPLRVAQHITAHTWTLDDARDTVSDTATAELLLHWMAERENALAAVGHGNVIRQAAMPAPLGWQLYRVATAAEILNRDPAISIGEQRLFDFLAVKEWTVRRGPDQAPSRSALDAGYLAAVPRRMAHPADQYPQIAITAAGLVHLHAALGGTDQTVLDQEH